MRSKTLILSTGLAMFSMFFGSGNLVFPLVVGQMSEGHYLLAALGILLTGVFVPFLGILAMLFFKGSTDEFFSLLGKRAPFWLSLICLSIMGPFGVLARCITVAHGAFQLLVPHTQLWVFSLVSCGFIFGLTLKKSRILPMLGTILTPFLLASLIAIALFGFSFMSLPEAQSTGSWESLKTGIFQGYQTMDLLAAFFFSTFVIGHLEKNSTSSETIPIFIRSSLIGAGLLSSIYFILVLLGSMYAPELAQVPPQEMLGYVAKRALGPWAAPLVATSVILACITTAIVLTSLFSDFFKKEIVIPLVTQKLAYRLRQSALKSTTADFANAPVLIEELSPRKGRDSPVKGRQVPCRKWTDSSANSAVNGRDCARAPVQYEGVCDRRFQGTLTQSIGQFLSDERYKERLSNSSSLVVTLSIAFITSTLEFSGIARYIGPLLEIMYPALIVLAILGIFHKLWGWQAVRTPFAATLILKFISSRL